MNKAEVVAKVSEKTGIAPEACAQVIKALEQELQEEMGKRPGVGVRGRIAGLVHLLTTPKQA